MVVVSFGEDKAEVLDSFVFSEEFPFAFADIFFHEFDGFEIFSVFGFFPFELGSELNNQLFGLFIHAFFDLVFELMIFMFKVGDLPH